MSKQIVMQEVIERSKRFIDDAIHVVIDEQHTNKLADQMKNSGKKEFHSDEKDVIKDEDVVKLELLAGSINYCYWYGKCDIRPGGSSSTLMYQLLYNSYEKNRCVDEFMVDRFIKSLRTKRFPLIEEREEHLWETYDKMRSLIPVFMKNIKSLTESMNVVLESLSGYASDMFLKRLNLLFMQLNRKLGWYEDDINTLIVPADYQVPNMLRHFNCMAYRQELSNKIANQDLILRGSRMECEIRAATILVCEMLVELTGWNMMDIDSWLWLRRKDAKTPFHLTTTTDY